MKNPIELCALSELEEKRATHHLVNGLDLVSIKFDGLIIDASAQQLHNFFQATNTLIKVTARACGYADIGQFNAHDLSTYNFDMHRLTGIRYAGGA